MRPTPGAADGRSDDGAIRRSREKFEALGGQAFFDVIDEVSALLTEDAIISMNTAVAIDKQDEADVAREFLEANGLL